VKALLLPLLSLVATSCEAQPSATAQVDRRPVGQQAASERPLPALSGRVMDQAGILSEASEAALTARLEALERSTSDQLVVVTLTGLEGERIDELGLRLGNGWGVGQKGLDNGVLLIVAPVEKQARIEVGKGLEGLLTDERAARIMEDHIVAGCGEERCELGIADGVAAIVATLESDKRRPRPRRAAAT
jgi:uncharacterized protein